MKRLVGILIVGLSLVGCATPQQNAALAGAVAGAVIGASIEQNSRYPAQRPHYPAPPPPVYHYPRPVHCSSVPVIVGYDVYGRPIYRYQQVCR